MPVSQWITCVGNLFQKFCQSEENGYRREFGMRAKSILKHCVWLEHRLWVQKSPFTLSQTLGKSLNLFVPSSVKRK